MKRTVRNYIIRIAIMAVLAAAVILVAKAVRPSWSESTEQRGDREIQQDYDLTLWYYDEALTPYVEQLQSDYFRKQGLRVGCELVSVVSFYENMNKKNVDGEGAPDLYITDTSRLEQAYLGSLAKENAYPDIYTLQNYSVKSLTSVRYGGRQVAYPLCFDMEYFVYNTDYMDRAPASFETIAASAESFTKQADSPIDMVILYDVNDLLFNYHFIGASLNLGGEAGDDAANIELNKEQASAALSVFKDLQTKTNINRATTTYDLVENSFVFGRSMTAILKCSSLEALNREQTNFAISPMPSVTAAIPSKALSTTWCVCVNPMSSHTAEAEALAKYMTYDNTKNIYELTGFMSAKRMDYSGKGYADVYMLYDESASLPKFIETEELWKDMKSMFLSIWDGGEAAAAFDSFEASVYLQLATRTGQEGQ